MKRKREEKDILFLPREIYDLIISFVPCVGSSWLHLRLVSKTFLASCERIQDPSLQNNEAIIRASAKGQVASVQKLLLDKRVDPKARYCEAMVQAVEGKHEAVVRALLADGRISPNDIYCEQTLTVIAFRVGHIPILEAFIDDPRLVFTTNPHLVVWAVTQGWSSVVGRLLRHPNYQKKDTLARYCAWTFPKGDHHELAREIMQMDGLAGRPFVDFFERQAEQGNINTIKMLIKDYPDKLGRFQFGNALLGATRNGHTDVVRELLAHERFAKGKAMTLSLWEAAKGGHSDIFRCLVDHEKSPGLDVFYASKKGKPYMSQLLCHPAIAMEIIGHKPEGVGQRLAECLRYASEKRMVEMILSDPRLEIDQKEITEILRKKGIHLSYLNTGK